MDHDHERLGRPSRPGQQEQANLDADTTTIGWSVGDLATATSREDVRALLDAAQPEDTPGRRANHTGQVWAFRSLINPGASC